MLDDRTCPRCATASVFDRPLRGVIVRKEPKAHGKGQQVEGPYESGESIVIVEDVVTTGGSSLKAIELCEAEGLKVERVLAIVDRLEGGREAFAEKGYERDDVAALAEKQPRMALYDHATKPVAQLDDGAVVQRRDRPLVEPVRRVV